MGENMESEKILETIHMISDENLDVRTITMGISLLDCIDSDSDKACQKIYDKITTKAKDLVKVGEQIQEEYGIPIINKRVTVTPISLIAAASHDQDYVKYALTLDKAAHTLGIDFIGGYSALVQKGYQSGDKTLIKSIPEALAQTDLVCASVNVGSTRSGINMDAVAEMGQAVKKASELDFMTNAKMVIFCNAVEDNPFMAGGFCGVSEPDTVINVGVSGPGVVKKALEKVKGASMDVVPKRSSKQRSKLRAWVKWLVPLPQNVSAFRLASSICRLHRRLPLGTPLRRFWKKSVSNKSAHTARRQLLPCSTMPLKRAASWLAVTSADCRAHSSPFPKMPG